MITFKGNFLDCHWIETRQSQLCKVIIFFESLILFQVDKVFIRSASIFEVRISCTILEIKLELMTVFWCVVHSGVVVKV